MGTRKKTNKKPKVSTLRNKADRLYQELGRLLFNKCFCGKEYSNLHHHIPKSRSSNLRYDLENGVPICAGCHFQHHNGDTRIAYQYIPFMKDLYDEHWEERLVNKSRITVKTDVAYYQETIRMLTNLINKSS